MSVVSVRLITVCTVGFMECHIVIIDLYTTHPALCPSHDSDQDTFPSPGSDLSISLHHACHLFYLHLDRILCRPVDSPSFHLVDVVFCLRRIRYD